MTGTCWKAKRELTAAGAAKGWAGFYGGLKIGQRGGVGKRRTLGQSVGQMAVLTNSNDEKKKL